MEIVVRAARRASRSMSSAPISSVCLRRHVHATTLVATRAAPTPASDVLVEDLFGEHDDLTLKGFSPSEPLKAGSSNRATSRKLGPERRLHLFNTLVEHVAKLSGSKLAIKGPQARNSAWLQLFSLATTSEQLERVANLFPRWRDTRRVFNDRIGDMFIRRCAELDCPTLALKVFGDHAKYNMPLSLEGARHLLYSLHLRYPIGDTITASALYAVYKLRPVSKDPTSAAILTYACLTHPNEKSLAVVKALIPGLKKYLAMAPPHPDRGFDERSAHLQQSLRKIKLKLAEDQSMANLALFE